MSFTYVVGLGSNLGSRAATFDAALALLDRAPELRVVGCSEVYSSEPLGPPQPSYFNAAARITSTLDAPQLLSRLLWVEHALGRKRTERWAARSIDLDLLWASEAHQSPDLTVPHRELTQRWFALQPLLDVAPELEPLYGEQLASLGERRPGAGTLEELMHADVERTQDGFAIHATGGTDEATAKLLSALGRAVHPSSTCQALRTVALPQHSHTLEPFQSACALIGQGFALAHTSVAPETAGTSSTTRLIGAFVEPYASVRVCDVRTDALHVSARFAVGA